MAVPGHVSPVGPYPCAAWLRLSARGNRDTWAGRVDPGLEGGPREAGWSGNPAGGSSRNWGGAGGAVPASSLPAAHPPRASSRAALAALHHGLCNSGARPGPATNQPSVPGKAAVGIATSPSRVASSMWRSDPQPRPLWDRSHFQENCKTLEEQMMDSSQSFPIVLGEVGWGRAWRRCHGVGGGGPCPHTARRGRGWPQGPGWATVPGERAAPRGQAAAGP